MSELDPAAFGANQPCFGCSPTHPFGFHLTFERDGDEVVTRFTPDDRYQGPPGIMHGGLVSTLADEVGAWAVIAGLGKFGFTAAMNLRYARPVRIGVPLEGRSRVTSSTGRTVRVAVRIVQSGAEAFTGELTFALFDRAGAEKLLGGPIPDHWLRYTR